MPLLRFSLGGLAAFLPLLAAGPAFAVDAGLVLDRQAAVAYTLEHNPNLLASRKQLVAAQSHVRQASAVPNPQLGFAVTGFNPTNQTGQTISLQMTQTLQMTPVRKIRTEMAKEDVRTAELGYTLASQTAINTTKKAYNQVLATRYALDVAKDNLDWNAKLAEAAAAKLKLGEIAAADSYRAQVALAQARQDFASAQNDLFVALAQLRVATGHMGELAIAPNSRYDVALLPLAPPTHYVKLGLQARPDLLVAASSVRHEALNESLLHATVMPGFDVVAGAGPVGGVPGASAGVNIPVPLWYRQEGEIAQSTATQAVLEYQRQALEQTVQAQIEQIYSQVALQERQIGLYQTQLLPNAKKLVDQTRQRYLYGDASGYELQDARRQYRQAQVAFGQAYLTYRNALADLETAIGADLPLPKE